MNALADWIKDGATWPQSGQRSWKKRWCKSPSAFFKKALKESFKNPFLIMPTNALNLALFSAAVLGFRHGFDYDHIAAISDITSVETDRKRAMRMGLVYVLGHAFMVAVLGGVVIFFQRSLPKSIDNWAERAVGSRW